MAAHDRGCLPILGARERDLLRVDDQPGRGPPAAPCPSGARRLVCLVALIVEGVAVTPLPLPIDGVDRLSSLCFPAFPHCIGVQALPGRCSWDCDRDPDGENDWSCVEGTHPSQKGRSFNPRANRSAFRIGAQGAIARAPMRRHFYPPEITKESVISTLKSRMSELN